MYKVLQKHDRSLLKTYSGHGDEVMDAQSSCDSGQIVSGGLDKSVILWDVATGTPTRRYRGHVAPVTAVRYFYFSQIFSSSNSPIFNFLFNFLQLFLRFSLF